MFSARAAMVVCVVALMGLNVLQADDYVWIEGEEATSHSMQRHGWYDSVVKENLSGGEWLSHYAGGAPPEAEVCADPRENALDCGWFPPRHALSLLTHADPRRLLRRALSGLS